MKTHGYQTLDDFCGKLSQKATANPAVYERAQFMCCFEGEKDLT
jgi:dihydroorotate dehydrogenase (fumarate)